jgi:hypothetical protein
VENASSLITAVIKAKPAVAKGKYVKSATVCSTMGPGVSRISSQGLYKFLAGKRSEPGPVVLGFRRCLGSNQGIIHG